MEEIKIDLYRAIDEASEEILCYADCIEDCKIECYSGKYLILDESDNIVYDSMPGVNFKM